MDIPFYDLTQILIKYLVYAIVSTHKGHTVQYKDVSIMLIS